MLRIISATSFQSPSKVWDKSRLCTATLVSTYYSIWHQYEISHRHSLEIASESPGVETSWVFKLTLFNRSICENLSRILSKRGASTMIEPLLEPRTTESSPLVRRSSIYLPNKAASNPTPVINPGALGRKNDPEPGALDCTGNVRDHRRTNRGRLPACEIFYPISFTTVFTTFGSIIPFYP